MTSFGRESRWDAKAGAIGARMDILKQEQDKVNAEYKRLDEEITRLGGVWDVAEKDKMAAECKRLEEEIVRLDGEWDYAASESMNAESIMRDITDLSGKGAQCVVAFDLSNWDLFGKESVDGWIPEGVREAPLHLEVIECPVRDYGSGKELYDTGHIKICAPLPPGWSEDVHYDDGLKDQLSNNTCMQRMADQGHGNYHMFSSTEETTGLWGGRFTWRVFYDENYDGKAAPAPAPAPAPALAST